MSSSIALPRAICKWMDDRYGPCQTATHRPTSRASEDGGLQSEVSQTKWDRIDEQPPETSHRHRAIASSRKGFGVHGDVTQGSRLEHPSSLPLQGANEGLDGPILFPNEVLHALCDASKKLQNPSTQICSHSADLTAISTMKSQQKQRLLSAVSTWSAPGLETHHASHSRVTCW